MRGFVLHPAVEIESSTERRGEARRGDLVRRAPSIVCGRLQASRAAIFLIFPAPLPPGPGSLGARSIPQMPNVQAGPCCPRSD